MSNADHPPSPGGDPAQPPPDLPAPGANQNKGTVKVKDGSKDKSVYGPVGGREVPAPEGAPKPHEIF